MKASRKSIHAKLYEFTYVSDLPGNLCPYFWKLVWGFLVFIPNFIIQIPSLVIVRLTKDSGLNDSDDRRKCGVIIYIMLAILYGYVNITYNWIKAMFNCYSYCQFCSNVGWIINTIILIGLAIWGIAKLTEERRSHANGNIKRSSIISEFIKAKYNRYCPKIDWE